MAKWLLAYIITLIIFPKVNDPKLLDYDLGKLTELYLDTLNIIAPNSNIKE